jgi:hypothetical protein
MLPRPPPEKNLYWFPRAASAVHDPPLVRLGQGLATQ